MSPAPQLQIKWEIVLELKWLLHQIRMGLEKEEVREWIREYNILNRDGNNLIMKFLILRSELPYF